MDLSSARERAFEILGGACSPTREPDGFVELGRHEGEGKGFLEQLQSMTPPGFPIPDLVFFGLTQLLDLPFYGPEEKMRWGVAFEFRGAIFAFELRKFGLRFLCEPANLDSRLVTEVLGRARGLTDVVESYLADELVPNALASGQVTVPNLYSQLDRRYLFLRAKALDAYAQPPPAPESGVSKGGSRWTRFDAGRPEREGGALATAAVDAFFSRSEFFFVVASAMREAPMVDGGLQAILMAGWQDRARLLLDLRDPATKGLYDELVAIREEWRNPLAHGGLHVGGASLYFHVPGVAALPFRLRRTPGGVKARFRLNEESFESILRVFDRFDDALSVGPLRFAKKWAESGLDVAFDEKSLSEYRGAMESDAVFGEYIEYMSGMADMHANMDY